MLMRIISTYDTIKCYTKNSEVKLVSQFPFFFQIGESLHLKNHWIGSIHKLLFSCEMSFRW